MSAVDQFQAQTETLAAQTQAEVLAAYAMLAASQIDQATATAMIAGAISRATAVTVALADLYVSSAIEEQTLEPTPATGVLPTDHSDRLVKAVTTVLNDGASNSRQNQEKPDQPPEAKEPANSADMRLGRLAQAEVYESAQQGAHDAMQEQPLVEGWVRQFDADPCQLCRWWWREGRVWPKAHRMPRHTGCNCQPRIVLAHSIKSTSYTRRLERANAPTGTRFERNT